MMTVPINTSMFRLLNILLLLPIFPTWAQDTLPLRTNRPDKARLTGLLVGASAAYGVSVAGLYALWYKDTGHQSFRFFNDNAEWKQVDKAGHFLSAFYLSYGSSNALKWAGLQERKSNLYGALTAFGVLLPVEILDGYSKAYGASPGDLIANAGGAAFFIAQKNLWNEVRIYPKFSAHHTDLAAKRPEMLGDNAVSRILKDYNGQTYWLSLDTDKFISFPKWLNIAFGYGAEEMLYGRDYQNHENDLQPNRQYYIALDFDLTSIKTRSKAVKALLFLGNMVKIPAPTLELSRQSAKFHILYF